MAKLLTHLVWYTAVNFLLVAVWVLTDGSFAELSEVATNPTEAMEMGFWPVWPILVWGTLVVIHAGTTTSNLLFGRRAVKRRRQMALEAAKAGRGIAREFGQAIGAARERRDERKATPPVPTSPERRWVTVLFSDVADSTHHNERLGDEEWHKVLGRVRGVVRGVLSERGGSEVGTSGDGLLARFATPADAVLGAIDIQSGLATLRAGGEFVPDVRIGIHSGEAVEDEGDLIGRVINLASRVSDEASPGEILVTEPVADQLVGHLELEDKGLRELKGMSQPRHLLAVVWAERP